MRIGSGQLIYCSAKIMQETSKYTTRMHSGVNVPLKGKKDALHGKLRELVKSHPLHFTEPGIEIINNLRG